MSGNDGSARGQGERCERRAGQVEGGRELEALGSTGPLYNSKTIESAASVTYPRARGRRVVAKVYRGRLTKKKKESASRLKRGKKKKRKCERVPHFSDTAAKVCYRIENRLTRRPVSALDGD